MADGYQLEVTSPGAEHPLKEYRDFLRNLGRKIKVFHTSKAMKSPLKGDLIDVQEDKIVISINGVAQEIFFTELDYAKVVLKW
jgi:ribosome maturation factor RimP